MDSSDIYLIGFLTLGGVVALLPVVIIGKLKIVGLLKGMIAIFIVFSISLLYYLTSTDAGIKEILTLKANTHLLPKRIFSVSYVLMAVFAVLIPVAVIRGIVKSEGSKA
ncbi:MAG: hypothetical protein AB2541_11375 [Candidatus Thiodiazotropha sp.]|nr:MAG: hypothetical protein DBP00_11845 [gamma proteobacterium symbiont of Ctena orbiculata]